MKNWLLKSDKNHWILAYPTPKMSFFLLNWPKMGDFSQKIAYPTPILQNAQKAPIPRQILHCGTGDSLIETMESWHIGNININGQWAAKIVALCLLPRTTKLAFFRQWAVGGCVHINSIFFYSYRPLPRCCPVVAFMGNGRFFFHPALLSGCICGQWAMGGCQPLLPGQRFGGFASPKWQWATRACHFEPV